MPDIDTDFYIERDDVIEYVTKNIREDRVAQIITFNRLTEGGLERCRQSVKHFLWEADHGEINSVVRGKPSYR